MMFVLFLKFIYSRGMRVRTNLIQKDVICEEKENDR